MVTLIVFVLEERKGWSNKALNELVFIGLGLYDEKDISLRGLEELKEADAVFAEFYTSLMPGFSIQKLEEMIGKTG